ncbi:MAG: hypothetical protein ACKVOH_04475 [Chlamydiales bacterium]
MTTLRRSKLFDQVVISSWWVILFFMFSYFFYDQAAHRRNREERRLRSKLEELIAQKEIETTKLEELELKLASREDKAWIEMVLLRKLGLVPEGQTKIHFLEE